MTACAIWSTALATAPGERVISFRAVAWLSAAARPICVTGFPPASDTPGYPYSVQVALEIFVKSMTWNVLPAAPWASPSFRPSERVGQAGAAPATVGLADAAGVALTVIVFVGEGAGLALLPHPAASAVTQVSAPPASTRRRPARAGTRPSMGEQEVIARFFLPRRLREPYDWYDVLYPAAVGRFAHVGGRSFPGR